MPFFTGYLAQGVGGATAFVENSSTGYARVPVTISSLSGGQSSLAATVTLYGSASITVTQRALYDAPSGGNLIMWWNLKTVKALTNSLADTINKGALLHTFPALYGPQGLGATPVPLAASSQIGVTSDGNPIYSGVALQVMNGTIAAAPFAGASMLGPAGSGTTLSQPINITVSGSYALSFASAGDVCYIVSLTSNTTLSVNPVAVANGYQRIFLYINPNGFTPTLPASNGTILENMGGAPPSVAAGSLSTTQLSEYVYSTYGTTIFGGAT